MKRYIKYDNNIWGPIDLPLVKEDILIFLYTKFFSSTFIVVRGAR